MLESLAHPLLQVRGHGAPGQVPERQDGRPEGGDEGVALLAPVQVVPEPVSQGGREAVVYVVRGEVLDVAAVELSSVEEASEPFSRP